VEQVTRNVFAETDKVGCDPAYVVTDQGVVLIDTPQLPSRALALREEIGPKGPVRYLINTEHHPDHVFGNYFFHGQGIVVGQERITERWCVPPGMDPWEKNRSETEKNDPEGLRHFPGRDEYWRRANRPAITFSSHLKIVCGGHEFECYHTGGHSLAQICVYCPQERVLFTGDTIFSRMQIFFAEADPEDTLKALEFLEQFDADRIVPGHGPVCGREAIAENRSFVLAWLSAVQDGIARGWSRSECMQRISFADRYPIDCGLEEVRHDLQKWNAGKLYDYLTSRGAHRGYDIFPS
jgi:cyclase